MTAAGTGNSRADSPPDRDVGYRVAADRDWLSTVRRTLPSLHRVLRQLEPTWSLPHDAITPEWVAAQDITTLFWDVDGTLTHRGAGSMAPEAVLPFTRLRRAGSLRHAILSNCGEDRAMELCALFEDVPVIRVFNGVAGPVVQVRRSDREEWIGTRRGELRLIRKPDPAIIEGALQALGNQDPNQSVMIGDQHLTDVACANLAGVRSIKVPTLGSTTPLSVHGLLGFADRMCYSVASASGRRRVGRHAVPRH